MKELVQCNTRDIEPGSEEDYNASVKIKQNKAKETNKNRQSRNSLNFKEHSSFKNRIPV